jgi:hypothetical protein
MENVFTRSMYERPINGKYLSIPPTLLPLLVFLPFKNLRLHMTSGSIAAEVWVRHDGSPSMNSKRISLELAGNNGLVCATVVRFSLDYSVVAYFKG